MRGYRGVAWDSYGTARVGWEAKGFRVNFHVDVFFVFGRGSII